MTQKLTITLVLDDNVSIRDVMDAVRDILRERTTTWTDMFNVEYIDEKV